MKKEIIKSIKLVSFLGSFITQIALFGVATIFIVAVSYLLGRQYLLGESLMGNDTFSFFTVVHWLSKYYPSFPFWFALQGGGVSFTGYPWFAAYLVNTISSLSSFNLVQSFRLLGFLSVPLTGIGIFVFCWARLTEVKPIWMRQVIGIIASFFYISAPVSWVWLLRWGFYAEQISLIFIPWILLFFDLFLERLFRKQYDFLFRVGIVGTVFFSLLGFMTHFYVGVASLLLFSALGLTRFLFQKEKKLELAKRLILPILGLIIALSAIFYFRLYSYSRYTSAVVRGGLVGSAKVEDNRTGTEESILTPKMMLSLEKDSTEKYLKPRDLIKDMRFPFYVWMLVLPSLIFGVIKSKNIFVFSMLSVIGFLVNTNIDIYILFSRFPVLSRIPILNQLPIAFLGRLFFVHGRIIIPIAAAYGAYIVWESIGSLFLSLVKKVRSLYYIILPFKVLFVFILTLVTFGVFLYKYYNLPYERERVNMGALQLDIRDIWGKTERPSAILTKAYTQVEEEFLKDNPQYTKIADYQYLKYICAYDGPSKPTTKTYPAGHICSFYPNEQASLFAPLAEFKKTQSACNLLSFEEQKRDNRYCLAFYPLSFNDQIVLKNWPKFNVSSSISEELEGTNNFFADLPKGVEYRYDVSGFAARTIMSTPLVNDNSQIQVYINNLSLIYNLWNYQSQIMYSIFPLYQKPGVLTELGKWFGLNYVYLSGTPLEPHSYWDEDANWVKVPKKIPTSGNLEVNPNEGWIEFREPIGSVTWDNRPKMLVVTDNSKQFYDETFKFMTRGGLLYDQAIPVMGKKNIDEYSLPELKQYESILMRAYGYKKRSKAYRLLDNYIKSGGNLIFDTGWQYNIPDYQLERAPSFMPFETLTWQNLNPNARLTIVDKTLLIDIDEAKLGDMRYGDNASWGVSTPGNLKGWAKPIVTLDGKPVIVAGQYGEGRVVWVGFNIVAHAEAKDAPDEAKMFSRLVSYLFEGRQKPASYNTAERRISPDEVEFTLTQSVSYSSNLFFREAFYPDWQARLISPNKSTVIPVRRAGPGFMLIMLPPVQAGDRIVLKLETSLGQHIANGVSGVTFVLLLLYIFIPSKFTFLGAFLNNTSKSILRKKDFRLQVQNFFGKKFKGIANLGKDEDENY